MKKPLKVLSTASLATIFATSALVPVAAAEQPKQQNDVEAFAVVQNDKIIKVTAEEYNEALLELNEVEAVQVFITNEGLAYLTSDFDEALAEAGSVSGAIELLSQDEDSLALELEQTQGYINDKGEFAFDEQPEDRLNETFFYNVA